MDRGGGADIALATAVARAIRAVDPALILLAPATSLLADAGRDEGLPVALEVFADRRYLGNGRLQPRSEHGAVIHDPEDCIRHVESMLDAGGLVSHDGQRIPSPIHSVCVHGDGASAVATAAQLPFHWKAYLPSMKPESRSAGSWLVPGAPVDVGFPVHYETASVSDSTGASAVLVPRDALVLGAVDVRVLVVEDGVARPVQVEIRASAGERALIVGPGLKPGDQVVTRGNERLRPGQEVKILETPAPAKEPAS